MRISGSYFGPAALQRRKEKLKAGGYPISKWIGFCEVMLGRGYKVKVYESRSTRSKYVTVCRDEKQFKVRFSNHRPSFTTEMSADSHFYVGVSNSNVTTTEDAVKATEQFFSEVPKAN